MHTVTVSSHTRRKPFAAQREAMTARLLAEIEALVDRQVSAAFKTFAMNTIRQAKAGRL